MVDSGALLKRCTGKTVPGVRIPPSPPVFPGSTGYRFARRADWIVSRRVAAICGILPRVCARAGTGIDHREHSRCALFFTGRSRRVVWNPELPGWIRTQVDHPLKRLPGSTEGQSCHVTKVGIGSAGCDAVLKCLSTSKPRRRSAQMRESQHRRQDVPAECRSGNLNDRRPKGPVESGCSLFGASSRAAISGFTPRRILPHFPS